MIGFPCFRLLTTYYRLPALCAEVDVRNRHIPDDPRNTFDTKTIRFYAFETSNETAIIKGPNDPRSILDPLQDRTCDQITGRRKKDATMKANNLERIVGLDGYANVGDRVIIST